MTKTITRGIAITKCMTRLYSCDASGPAFYDYVVISKGTTVLVVGKSPREDFTSAQFADCLLGGEMFEISIADLQFLDSGTEST